MWDLYPAALAVHGRKKRRRRPSDSVEVELVACGPLLRVGRQEACRVRVRRRRKTRGWERGRSRALRLFAERDPCEGVFGISGLDFFFCPEGNRDCGLVAVDL